MGRIEASTDVEVLEIEDPDQVIELYERQMIHRAFKDETTQLKIFMEKKFPYLQQCSELLTYN